MFRKFISAAFKRLSAKRHLATPFMAWLRIAKELSARLNRLKLSGLSQSNKEVKTPFGIFSNADHAVNDVARWRVERGKTAKAAFTALAVV